MLLRANCPGDCAVPLKSNLVHVTQIEALGFLSSKSTRADFSVDGTDLQLIVEAHAPGVYRLRCGSAEVLNNEKPSARERAHTEMLLAREEAVGELAVSSNTDPFSTGWRLEQGDVVLELSHSPMRIALYRNDVCVLRSSEAGLLAYAKGDGRPDGWALDMELDPDDALHGLGRAQGDLDKRGQRLVSDAANADTLPFLWSPMGWGLYFNTLNRIEHDLGNERGDLYRAGVWGRTLDIFLFAGEPTEILNQYTALTGRAGQPGLWPMGVWLDQAPGQSVQDVLQIAGEFRQQQLGLDVVRLAEPALYGFQSDKPVFEWDAARVPDARDMFASAQALNLHLAAPSFPGVPTGTYLFEEWEDRGWLLLDDEDSSAHVFPGTELSGGKPYALLDLTHKDVYKLWCERQRQFCDDGLGAPISNVQYEIPDGITARGGETGAVLRTVYPILVRKALFDAVAGHKTPQEGVAGSTSLFPGAQRYAWQLAPRVANDWSGIQSSLRSSLSLGDGAVPVQMHTLGVADAPTDAMTPELYLRWLAMAVFSANFSFQAVPALLPTAQDDATRALVQHWLQWRYRLVPYVLGIIEDAVRTGLPVQRSMALAFPDDPVAQVWDTQYMFGPALLVAPVLQPGEEQRVYLPKGGAWWDLNTGWRYEGGTTWAVKAGLDTIPVFGREGHMLCLGPVAQHTGDFNSARMLDEVWMFGMPEHSPVVMRNKIRVMQMQGSSYIKGLEGLRILPSEGLEVKRRGAEVRISRAR